MSILNRNLCFAFFFLLMLGQSFSQTLGCGFKPSPQLIQKIKSFQSVQKAGATAPTKCLNKKLSLAIHIITDSLHQPNITQTDINTALASLNQDFSSICLSFFICKQDTIYNYKYYKFNNPEEISEVHQVYEVQNMINVYVVGSIIPPVEAGFASFSDNYMVLSHQCVTSNDCWSHEMGHFFSLLHTFDTSVGLEYVDGTNCTTAGDLICDTPADINPAPVSNTCQWTGTNTDPHGDFYTPIIGNIMSYHPYPQCKTPFTVGQLNQMLNYFISYRNYLY